MDATIAIESTALTVVPTEDAEPKEPGAVTWAREAFTHLRYRLSGKFLEREGEIMGLMLAMIARQHVMLLGVPGTGKSALVNDLCAALQGAKHFQWLLTRYSVPDEVFGTLSLAGLKEDKFRRITTNKLPEAEIAFLDEIWKANSAVLNALLTLVNERKFHNDGQVVDVPLEMLVGASNELPESEELSALYDRFLFRFQVMPIQSGYSFGKMLAPDTSHNERYWDDKGITLEQLHTAQAAAADLSVDPGVIDALYEIKRECEREAIAVSDRRWKASLSAMRAAAWLDGEVSVSKPHLDVLRDIIWSEPAQRPKVIEIVAKHAVSASYVAGDLVDSVISSIEKYEAESEESRANKLLPLLREVKNCNAELTKMLVGITGKRERAGVEGHQKRLNARKTTLQASAMKLMGVGE